MERPPVDSLLEWITNQMECSNNSHRITLFMINKAMLHQQTTTDLLNYTTSIQPSHPNINMAVEVSITHITNQTNSATIPYLMTCQARVPPCLVVSPKILWVVKDRVESWIRQQMMIQEGALPTPDKRWKRQEMAFDSWRPRWQVSAKVFLPTETKGLRCTTLLRIVLWLISVELTQELLMAFPQWCPILILIT